MKATLAFDLSDPGESQDHAIALHGQDMVLVLYDLSHYLRTNTKYAPDTMPEAAHNAYQDVRDHLYALTACMGDWLDLA